jgi:hypothetical protein
MPILHTIAFRHHNKRRHSPLINSEKEDISVKKKVKKRT